MINPVIPGRGESREPGMTTSLLCELESDMTHPGEQFYPEGVHWDDPIARGTLPELLSKAAAEFGDRAR